MAVAIRTITRIQDADDASSYVLLASSDIDNILRNWAAGMASMLSSVSRTDYSATRTLYTGAVMHAGSIHVQATVTWPDGSTGHCDAVEYPEAPGVLQYYTASHTDSGKIVVQAPLDDGVAALSVVTPDYYLDSAAAGGGAGTLASPYATFAELPTLQSGDVLALKSGSKFRETLTLVDGVSVYRYATGARPIIDASDVIAGTWVNDLVYTNLWYVDVTPEVIGVTDIDTNLWREGVYPADARSTTLAAANGTPGSFYVDNDLAATQRIHYYPTASNPNADGAVYEFNTRGECISGSWPASVTIDGIVCRRQRSGSGSAVLGRNVVTRFSEFNDGTKHNLYMRDGGRAYGCKLIGAMWSGLSATLSVYNEATPAALGIDVHDTVFDSGRTTFSKFAGGYGHYNTSGSFGPVIYSRCYFNRLAAGVQAGFGAFDGITVSGGVQVAVTVYVALDTLNAGIVTVENNIVIGPATRFAGSGIAQTHIIRNNYIYVSGQGGAIPCLAGTAYIYNNELRTDGTVALSSRRAIRYETGSTAVVRCYNNRFLGTLDGSGAAYDWGYYYYSLANPTPRIYSDLNHYGNSAMLCYFPQNSFNNTVANMIGATLTNVSDLASAAGSATQDAKSLIFA